MGDRTGIKISALRNGAGTFSATKKKGALLKTWRKREESTVDGITMEEAELVNCCSRKKSMARSK